MAVPIAFPTLRRVCENTFGLTRVAPNAFLTRHWLCENAFGLTIAAPNTIPPGNQIIGNQ